MTFGGGFRGDFPERRSSKKSPPPGASLDTYPYKGILIPQERIVRISEPRFHVVILSNSSENLRACLRGIFRNEPDLVGRVIIVDDGCKKDGLEELPGITWVNGAKPFVFARNANLGIKRALNDVVLLNDDAVLQTPKGLSILAQAVHERPKLGICSAGITGHVGNVNQYCQESKGVRAEAQKLAFMCVYISRRVIRAIGPLDERFVGYGYEDDDYCLRAQNAGFQMGTFDTCVVNHGDVPSTFRAMKDYDQLITANRVRYEEKWKHHLSHEDR